MTPLHCPRDKQPLSPARDSLTCPAGHVYSIYEGVPILLVDNVPVTHDAITLSLNVAQGQASIDFKATPQDLINGDVQRIVGATNGFLYKPLIGNLSEYPIPEIRLPIGSGRLLDIGCSWGRWSISAARKGYQVTGIDPDIGTVITARRVAHELGVKADFLVADARFLPFPDQYFDVAFSYSVLQHFSKPDAQAALREVRRVLHSKGQSLIQMPNKYGVRSLYHQARAVHRPPSLFSVRYYSPTELLKVFRDCIGPSTLSVDGFFGLGIQSSDWHLLPWSSQIVVAASEACRSVSRIFPLLQHTADSLYVTSQPRQ